MATARRLDEPTPPTPVNCNVPGTPIIVLELDENEAEAVRWSIITRGRQPGEVKGERAMAATGVLPSTSLSASAIRVADALVGLVR